MKSLNPFFKPKYSKEPKKDGLEELELKVRLSHVERVDRLSGEKYDKPWVTWSLGPSVCFNNKS